MIDLYSDTVTQPTPDMRQAMAQAVGGQGQVLGTVGEPGMGKSRLLAEWRQQLHAHGVTYLEGRCLSYGSTTPYLPVLDWLRRYCGITPADGADAITAKVCGRLQAVGLAPDSVQVVQTVRSITKYSTQQPWQRV